MDFNELTKLVDEKIDEILIQELKKAQTFRDVATSLHREEFKLNETKCCLINLAANKLEDKAWNQKIN